MSAVPVKMMAVKGMPAGTPRFMLLSFRLCSSALRVPLLDCRGLCIHEAPSPIASVFRPFHSRGGHALPIAGKDEPTRAAGLLLQHPRSGDMSPFMSSRVFATNAFTAFAKTAGDQVLPHAVA